MRYVLISKNGMVKQYERLPRSINPKDVLIETHSKDIVNRSMRTLENGTMVVDNTSKQEAIDVAQKLNYLKVA